MARAGSREDGLAAGLTSWTDPRDVVDRPPVVGIDFIARARAICDDIPMALPAVDAVARHHDDRLHPCAGAIFETDEPRAAVLPRHLWDLVKAFEGKVDVGEALDPGLGRC